LLTVSNLRFPVSAVGMFPKDFTLDDGVAVCEVAHGNGYVASLIGRIYSAARI
jgi:hypothetical protein